MINLPISFFGKISIYLSIYIYVYIYIYIYIYLFLSVLGLQCCLGFSLVADSQDYSLVAVHRLCTVVAFSCCRTQALGHKGCSSCGSQAQAL